jgi:hypothetical protein
MRSIALLLGSVLGLSTCAFREAPPPRPAVLGEPARIAVVPFLVGGELDREGRFVSRTPVPGDADAIGVLFADRLGTALIETGASVVDGDETAGAAELAALDGSDPSRAAQIGRRVGANVVVVGAVTRWVERVGTTWAIESPASVTYQVAAVRTADAVVVLIDRFDYTQRALMENLLELPKFLQARGRWLTRDEIAEGALENTAARVSSVVGVRRPTAAR